MMKNCMICGESKFRKRGMVAACFLLECRACGLQFLDPFPDPAVLHDRYDHYYDAWGIDQAGGVVPEMKRATFRRYLERLRPFAAQGTLLDVGCATGELMATARERGFDVYGAEIAPDGIARCRELFGTERIVGKQLQQGDFPEQYFDVITLSDVLEHFPDPLGSLDMLGRMLKPGGHVMIVTPDTSSWTRKVSGAKWPHYKEDHQYYFSRSNLAKMMSGRFDVLVAERAYKTLTLNYVAGVVQGYRDRGLARMLARFIQHLPVSWRTPLFSVHIGEMFVLLKKRPE